MRLPAFYCVRWRAARVAALVISALLGCLSTMGEGPVTEGAAKIQFLHYLAQYAVWPKEALPPIEKNFVIGVLGENPFGDALENYFKGKSVKNRSFVVRYFKTAEEARGCHLLFISSSEKANFTAIIEQLSDSSVLTVSDSDGFIQKNGMIFIFITPKSEITSGLGWDINPQAMKRARLQIDPFFIEKARKFTD